MKWFRENIVHCIDAHECSLKDEQEDFNFENIIFALPSLWATTMILMEKKLTEDVRRYGYQALLFYALLKNTTEDIPINSSGEGGDDWAEDMLAEEKKTRPIFVAEPHVQLLTLYRLVSEYFSHDWQSEEEQAMEKQYLWKLSLFVESYWGDLNITKMVRSL